jgi:hypothetical protein
MPAIKITRIINHTQGFIFFKNVGICMIFKAKEITPL